MDYFKSAEGMFTSAFEQGGEVDDTGNKIKATEQPMTEAEYRAYLSENLKEKIKQSQR